MCHMNGERHSGSLECVGFLESRNTQPLVVLDVLFLKLHTRNCPGERKKKRKESHKNVVQQLKCSCSKL